jgi:hypothetical protein
METLIERCAGLDVHKASVTACVRCRDPIGLGGARPGHFALPRPGW